MNIKQLVQEKISTLPQIGEIVEIDPNGLTATVAGYIIKDYYGGNKCVIKPNLETFYDKGFNREYFIEEQDIEDIDYFCEIDQ